MDDLAPHGEESVEFLVDDELFYNAGDLTVPDSGIDMRQGPSGPGPKPYPNDGELMDQDDDHMEEKGEKSGGMDLGAFERLAGIPVY